MKSAPKSRLAWADAAKGIGIILVVFGHAALGLMNANLAPDRGPLSTAVTYVYVFHMPLFFWLSGLFARNKLRSGFLSYFSQILRVIAYPYVLWASLQICVQTLLTRFTNQPASFADLLSLFTHPSRQFWFLYVLALIKGVHWLLARTFTSDVSVFAASLVLHAAVPLILENAWSPLLLTFYYLPLVTSATMLAPYTHLLYRLARPLGLLAALACLAFVAISKSLIPMGEAFLPPQALAGVVGVVLVSVAILPSGESDEIGPFWTRVLRMLGAASLEIYVAHTMASAGFRIVLKQLGITNLSLHLIGGTLVGILFPLVLLRAAEKADLRYLFTWRQRESGWRGPPVRAP